MKPIHRRTFLSGLGLVGAASAAHSTGIPAFIKDMSEKQAHSVFASQLDGSTIYSVVNGDEIEYTNCGLGRVPVVVNGQRISLKGLEKQLLSTDDIDARKQIVFDFAQSVERGNRVRPMASKPLTGQIFDLTSYDPYLDQGIVPVVGADASYNGQVIKTDDEGRFTFDAIPENDSHPLIIKTTDGLMNIKSSMSSRRPLDFYVGSTEEGHRWYWNPKHLSAIHNPTTYGRPARWAFSIGNGIGERSGRNSIPVYLDEDNAPAGAIDTLRNAIFEVQQAVNNHLAQYGEPYWEIIRELTFKFDMVKASRGDVANRGINVSWYNIIPKFAGVEYASDPSQPTKGYLIAGNVRFGSHIDLSTAWHELVIGHAMGRNHDLRSSFDSLDQGSCMSPSTGSFTPADVLSLVALYSSPNYANLNEGHTLDDVEPVTVNNWGLY
ncbi:MAG: hypothetical protein P9L94_10700 [Candidatus Hinthialibacter antarcticus]|nr:hypothetical protein [Candidatus Hinthialibacter antarcticus]